jgi:hypothetical protein
MTLLLPVAGMPLLNLFFGRLDVADPDVTCTGMLGNSSCFGPGAHVRKQLRRGESLMHFAAGGSIRDVASRSSGSGLNSASWGSALSLSGSMMLGGGRHSAGSSSGTIRDFSASRHSFSGSTSSSYWDRSLISMYEPVSAPQ